MRAGTKDGNGARRRLWLGAVIGLAAGALSAGPAEARTYEVYACVSNDNPLQSWSPYKSNSFVSAYAQCPAGPSAPANWGVVARNSAPGGAAPNGSTSAMTFEAPAQTAITRIRGNFRFGGGSGWKAGLRNEGQGRWEQVSTSADLVGWEPRDYPGLWSTQLQLMVTCTSTAGCPADKTYGHAGGSQVYITLEDGTAPVLSAGRGNLLTAPEGPVTASWLRGSQSIGFDASDNTGIKRGHVEIDGVEYGRWDFACDYSYKVPCTSGQKVDATMNTAGLADGGHPMRLLAYDAAGNEKVEWKTIYTDNTAPTAPTVTKQVTENSAGWTNSDRVRFTYPVPGSAAPVNRTDVQVCNQAGVCSTRTAVGDGSGDDTMVLPSEGVYTLRARLLDAAGNVGGFGDEVTVKYDKTPPGAAQPAIANGWVGKQEAADYQQRIEGLQLSEFMPMSGLAGFAVTTDGSTPGSTVTPGMDGEKPAMTIAQLSEGVTTVKARAISNAGLASAEIGSTRIPVDLTDPTVALSGTVSEGKWQAEQAELTIRGVDPNPASGAAASGMDPGPTTPESGAYVEYSLDGREFQPVKGDQATLTVGDGDHKITYRAFDLAGNVSDTKTTTFKVDVTAPSPVAFELPDADAPHKVTVVAGDATSGVKSGQVQMLNLDTHGGWTNLGSALSPDANGRMVASTRGADAGRYRLRAVVTDHAGNQTITEKTVSGGTYDIVVLPGSDGGNGPVGSVPGNGQTPPMESGLAYVGGDVGNGHSGKGNPNGTQTQVISGLVQKAKVKQCAKAGRTKASRRRATSCQKALTKASRCPKPGRTVKSKAAAAKCVAAVKSQALAKRGEKMVDTLKVKFGKSALMRGRVSTLTGDKAIPNGEVAVWAEMKSAWAAKGRRAFAKIATVETNAKGVFAYRVPKGATRIIRAEYLGDANTTDSWRDHLARVPAQVTIKANKKSLRNQQSVRLSGKLTGRPIPASGKILTVQAYDGEKWRTIATVRASRTGAWKFSYRFTRTTGTRTYKFRVQALDEAVYAYDAGTSKPIAVKVRG